MTLGEKIRKLRTQKGMTQSELCDKKFTRNLLSEIESGKANPSFDNLRYIANRLNVPLPYLLSEDEDLFYYLKKSALPDIKKLLEQKKYKPCIEMILELHGLDDELNYLLSICYFELGKSSVLGGSLVSGKRYLSLFTNHASCTCYDTTLQRNSALLYSALAENIQSPLLELDTKSFEKTVLEDFDYDFYRYICSDDSYVHTNPMFKNHKEAKELIKTRKYKDALKILLGIVENKTPGSYNSYLIFSVYADIEHCYKQLLDFENAYRYASKRLSIIEGFKL